MLPMFANMLIMLYKKFVEPIHPSNLGTYRGGVTTHTTAHHHCYHHRTPGAKGGPKFYDTARRYSKTSSSVFLFSRSRFSSVYSLSVDGGCVCLGLVLGLDFAAVGWGLGC